MYNYKAKCVKIIDGDTLDLEIDLGFNITIKERIRLARVNTPEIRGSEKEQGLVAKDFVDGKINQLFTIEDDSKDQLFLTSKTLHVNTSKGKGKYGRWIAEVVYEEDGNMYNLSDVLIKEGLAQEGKND